MPIQGEPRSIRLDTAVLRVCGRCSSFGKPVIEPRRPVPQIQSPKIPLLEKEDNLPVNYNLMIRKARERLGLTQEQVGRRIGEKSSVVRLLESGRLKPDVNLVKKIEHELKIRLEDESTENS